MRQPAWLPLNDCVEAHATRAFAAARVGAVFVWPLCACVRACMRACLWAPRFIRPDLLVEMPS